jgi:hypothetical protein
MMPVLIAVLVLAIEVLEERLPGRRQRVPRPPGGPLEHLKSGALRAHCAAGADPPEPAVVSAPVQSVSRRTRALSIGSIRRCPSHARLGTSRRRDPARRQVQ